MLVVISYEIDVLIAIDQLNKFWNKFVTYIMFIALLLSVLQKKKKIYIYIYTDKIKKWQLLHFILKALKQDCNKLKQIQFLKLR